MGWKDRKVLAAELQTIYQAASAEADEAATKRLFLALRNITKEGRASGHWMMSPRTWKDAANQAAGLGPFAALFGERFTASLNWNRDLQNHLYTKFCIRPQAKPERTAR